MNNLKIKDIEKQYGTTHKIVLYCNSIEERETKSKETKKYLLFHLTDGEKEIDAKRWNYSMEDFENAQYPVKIPGVLILKLDVQEYNGQPCYIIQGYTSGDKYPATMFAKKAPIDAEETYQKILADAREYREPLASVITTLYEENHEKFVKWGAAKRVHHNVSGGLLYHIGRMHDMAKKIGDLYECDKELLMAGVDIHDIGKLRELETDDLGVSDYTVEGNLKGHIVLGYQMLADCIREHEFENTTELIKLEHMILSHHGKMEWGSPVIPAFLEANLLHYLDLIDSQGEQIERITREAQPGISRPPYCGAMKNNILFKG